MSTEYVTHEQLTQVVQTINNNITQTAQETLTESAAIAVDAAQSASSMSIPIKKIRDNGVLARRDEPNVFLGYCEFQGDTNIGGGSSKPSYSSFMDSGTITKYQGFVPTQNVSISGDWGNYSEGFLKIPETGVYSIVVQNRTYVNIPNADTFLNIMNVTTPDYVDFPDSPDDDDFKDLVSYRRITTSKPSSSGRFLDYGASDYYLYLIKDTFIYCYLGGDGSKSIFKNDTTNDINTSQVNVFFQIKKV